RAGIFGAHGEEIKSEVLAEGITLGKAAGYTKDWNINGENVTLGVEKFSNTKRGFSQIEITDRRSFTMSMGFDKETFKKSVIYNVKKRIPQD
ncbi:hypothetical protein NPN23_23645, partial [Vibrio parahaemolyticus]|nr:hypothetical protein [Vibrio parahaemolyticus]